MGAGTRTTYRFVRTSGGGTSTLVEVTPKKEPSSERQMGVVSSITIGGEDYTIQTEDMGLDKGEIVTLAFLNGHVVKETRYSYKKHTSHPNLQEILPKAVQMNHEAMASALRREKGGLETPPPLLKEEKHLSAWDLLLQRTGEEKRNRKKVPWDEIVKARRREAEAEENRT